MARQARPYVPARYRREVPTTWQQRAWQRCLTVLKNILMIN